MIRAYYLSAGALLVLLLGVLGHYAATDREAIQKKIEDTVAVTGLASPSIAAAWYEPRLRRFQAAVNPAYPELLPPERQSFVYGVTNVR